MMLAKPEFVTVYEVLLSEEDMENNIGELTINFNTIMSEQENGRLFMAFKKNNDHVNSRVFRLSNDVKRHLLPDGFRPADRRLLYAPRDPLPGKSAEGKSSGAVSHRHGKNTNSRNLSSSNLCKAISKTLTIFSTLSVMSKKLPTSPRFRIEVDFLFQYNKF